MTRTHNSGSRSTFGSTTAMFQGHTTYRVPHCYCCACPVPLSILLTHAGHTVPHAWPQTPFKGSDAPSQCCCCCVDQYWHTLGGPGAHSAQKSAAAVQLANMSGKHEHRPLLVVSSRRRSAAQLHLSSPAVTSLFSKLHLQLLLCSR
jgi:hypothetical protein